MNITKEQVEAARRWLEEQRAVVHPGPIETVREALDMLEGKILDHERRAARQAPPYSEASRDPAPDASRPMVPTGTCRNFTVR